jgi:hypothetical protein
MIKTIFKQIHIAGMGKHAFFLGSVTDIQLGKQLLAMNNLIKVHYFLKSSLNAFTPDNYALGLPPSPASFHSTAACSIPL